MISHYLTLALRALLRKKLLFAINVGGLGVGIASCAFIIWFVIDELTYDRHQSNADKIFRVTLRVADPANTTRIRFTDQKIGPYLKRTRSEVAEFVRFDGFNFAVQIGDELLKEEGIFRADPSVFNVFDIEMLEGNSKTALLKKSNIVLSETLARKYFKDGHALGKSMIINGEPYEVTGVMKDFPANSDKVICGLVGANFPGEENQQLVVAFDTYIMFKSPLSTAHAQNVLDLARKQMSAETPMYEVQALPDLHFTDGIQFDNPKGNKTNIYIFLMVAGILMLVVIFNFVNLTTVQSLERAKEVGVRKVNGATPGQLTRQFLGESFVTAGLAGVIAVTLLKAFHFLFHTITGKEIEFTSGADLLVLIGAVVVLLAVAIVSAIYPAKILSRLRPAFVLRGRFSHQPHGNSVRKIFIVAQFALSSFLLVFLSVVIGQINRLNKSELGFNKDDVIVTNVPGDKASSARDIIAGWPGVHAVSVVEHGSVPGQEVFATSVWITEFGAERELNVQQVSADRWYADVLQLKTIEGDALWRTDDVNATPVVIVNEAFARAAGWENPIGKEVQLFDWAGRKKATIGGLIEDFHFRSLHNTIEPLMYVRGGADGRNLCIRIDRQRLADLKATWKKTFPDFRLEHYNLSDSFDAQYQAERLLLILLLSFSVLTVVLAGLGLFGLTSYHVETRTKEIGIRKVLGANTYSIIELFSKHFIRLVLAGTLIGSFASVYFCRDWLNTFAYKIELAFWLPLIPAALIVLFSLLVTTYRIYLAASLNPVKTLKYE